MPLAVLLKMVLCVCSQVTKSIATANRFKAMLHFGVASPQTKSLAVHSVFLGVFVLCDLRASSLGLHARLEECCCTVVLHSFVSHFLSKIKPT